MNSDMGRKVVVGFYMMMAHEFLERGAVRSRKIRRWWVRDLFKKRELLGYGNNLIREMMLNDYGSLQNFIRMSKEQFQLLLSMVGPLLTKESIRKPISEQDRLMITLRFLATGMNYCCLSFAFRVSKTTVHRILKETTDAIWSALHEKFINKPSKQQLKEIAANYFVKTGMPNCIGAIDGKHCVIQAPCNSGSLYRNYKSSFSVVLLGVCDADCNFTYVNVGAFGSESDGGILRRTDFGQRLLNNQLDLPDDSNLPNTSTLFPYYIVGDEAFPMKRHLLRPYGGRNLSSDKEVFNKRLSSARRTIENTFGIMVSKFRIFHTTISADPDLANSIIKSAVVLHNFIRKTGSSFGATTDDIRDCTDSGNWTQLRRFGSNHTAQQALNQRDILKNYLNDTVV